MRTSYRAFVVGCIIGLGSGQSIGGTEAAVSPDHTQTTRPPIYPITRVTPATLPAGDTDYFSGVTPFADWTKRVGLAWYFDRICPCNWGCKIGCDWCAHDNRWPEWYNRGLHRSYEDDNGSDSDEDVGGVEPNHNLGPLYNCDDPLDDGIIIEMEPALIDYDAYEYEITTDYLADELDHSVLYVGEGQYSDRDVVHHFPEVNSEVFFLTMMETTHTGVQISDNPLWPEGVMVQPGGIKYTNVWWTWSINRPKAIAALRGCVAVMRKVQTVVPAGKDVLFDFGIWRQAIHGKVLIDVMTMAADTSPYLTWKMTIPRANYFVYISSDDNEGYNYYYPRVNEILCGPAADPPTCRTHDQRHGRIVNRVAGEFEGFVAPFVNTTIYEWDRDNTNFDDRFQMDVISVDRRIFGDNVLLRYVDSVATTTPRPLPTWYANRGSVGGATAAGLRAEDGVISDGHGQFKLF